MPKNKQKRRLNIKVDCITKMKIKMKYKKHLLRRQRIFQTSDNEEYISK